MRCARCGESTSTPGEDGVAAPDLDREAGRGEGLRDPGGCPLLLPLDRADADAQLPVGQFSVGAAGVSTRKLSLWWFDQLADLVPNHVISGTDVPAEWAGPAIRCRRLDVIQVECIARGYLAGLGLEHYRATQAISAVPLPAGVQEGSKLPQTVFTPTTKASGGAHDEFITFDDVVDQVGRDTAEQLRGLTTKVYERGAAIAADAGIIIADTKFEFGRDASGSLVLADEILTSDSSRF